MANENESVKNETFLGDAREFLERRIPLGGRK